jgi:hypothetical protein
MAFVGGQAVGVRNDVPAGLIRECQATRSTQRREYGATRQSAREPAGSSCTTTNSRRDYAKASEIIG